MKIPSFLRGTIRYKGGVTRKEPKRTPPPSKCQKQGVGRQTIVASKPPGPPVAETPEPGGSILCVVQYSSKHSAPLTIFISCNETPDSPVVAETSEPGGPRLGSNVPSGRDLVIRLNLLDPAGWQESGKKGGISAEKSGAGKEKILVYVSRARPATDRSPGKIGVDIPAVHIRIEGEPYTIPGVDIGITFDITEDQAESLRKYFDDSYTGVPAEYQVFGVPTSPMNTLDSPAQIGDNDWEPSVDLAFYNLEHPDEVMQCPYCLCWTYILTGERCGNCGEDVTMFIPRDN